MDIETDTVIPNSKEEDLETEMDGKEVTATQGQDPREDTETIEIVVESGEGIAVGTEATDLHGDMEETMSTEIEIEKKGRTQTQKMKTKMKKK